ncbi:MAG TPA: diguanylate cyclase [Solirubrobacteraceae bacterium]|jgi:diguanylate cyclase (GGDEF)-like protein|nr:diguanylate cyclase [Solirubrobacteraceae bacterium]
MPLKARSLCAWIRQHSEIFAIDPIERDLGGHAGGILYIFAGISAASYPLLPGAFEGHLVWLFLIAVSSVVWGLVSLFVIDWATMNPYVTHGSTLFAQVGVGIAVASTGGSHSAAWIYLFWISLFGCYFYARPLAMFYVFVSIVVQSVPLFYDSRAVTDGFLPQLIVAGTGYIAVGGIVSTGKRMVDGLRLRAETLAAEQGALQRAASAVIRGKDADHIFQLVSSDLAQLLGISLVNVSRYDSETSATVLGTWDDGTVGGFERGVAQVFDVDGGFAQVLASRSVVRNNSLPESSLARSRGCKSTLLAPIMIDGAPWGVISLASPDPNAFKRADEQRIQAFAEMLARIVTSLDDRARLETEALTDQLTGLPNHRAVHQRLRADLAAAARHAAPLSVAMIDVDNFKEINDRHGHDRGDAVLGFVAECMRRVSRANDTVGRLGGDEFMWILPDTNSSDAVKAVERARELIAHGRGLDAATTSVGICDTISTSDPAELVRRADVALYASKASGRNQVTLYDAEVAEALDAEAREAWFERSQALSGLRALARAIDAKDPATNEHSERVAQFAGQLAHAGGWPDERVARLREAALVHDVGKLAVPDALLTKPGQLSDGERLQMSEHVGLSARIVGSILSEEQVGWIRGHHERPDGRGYPAGLNEHEISDGAALLALADAWDVMVAGRAYSRTKSVDEAYEECLSLVGLQFTPAAIAALRQLHADGTFELRADGESLADAARSAVSR